MTGVGSLEQGPRFPFQYSSRSVYEMYERSLGVCRQQMNSELKKLFLTGAISSLAVAAAAAACGKADGQSVWKPINTISHILWGRRSAGQSQLSFKYTGAGLLLNGVACVFWAWVYREWQRSLDKPPSISALSQGGFAVAALAYLTDYHLVPTRFTPGFELSLSRRNFPWLYATLAAGLILPEWIVSKQPGRPSDIAGESGIEEMEVKAQSLPGRKGEQLLKRYPKPHKP